LLPPALSTKVAETAAKLVGSGKAAHSVLIDKFVP
jgi:hypothetical protein